MTKPLELGSPEDPESCLVVCHEYRNDLPRGVTAASYRPLRTSYGVLLPLDWSVHSPTSYVLEMAKCKSYVKRYRNGGRMHYFSHKDYNQVLSETRAGNEKFVILLVAGKRLLGTQDCYVDWMHEDGQDIVSNQDLSIRGSATRIYNLKHGAGCLFSRRATFDEQGNHTGFETTVVTIETGLYYGPPDNLRLDFYGHTYTHTEEHDDVRLPDFFAKVHQSWIDVYEKAKAGFLAECDPWSAHKQAAMTSDQADEENFAAIVSELDWVAALDMAEEPWQLAVICRTLQPPEFAQRRTPYKRGRDMVAQYLSRRPGRADLVQQMWDKIKLQLIA